MAHTRPFTDLSGFLTTSLTALAFPSTPACSRTLYPDGATPNMP
ncbi:hypothetical protein [Maricaulis sp.]|nr:hypothetical protein [Maricaulis sp.]